MHEITLNDPFKGPKTSKFGLFRLNNSFESSLENNPDKACMHEVISMRKILALKTNRHPLHTE